MIKLLRLDDCGERLKTFTTIEEALAHIEQKNYGFGKIQFVVSVTGAERTYIRQRRARDMMAALKEHFSCQFDG